VADADPRGTLVVADRAVTRIARQVTLDVPGVAAEDAAGAVERRLGRAYPRVFWTRVGNRSSVQVEVAITWPAAAGAVAAAVQASVRHELEHLAGQRVDRVDVSVREVVRPRSSAPEPRVR